MIFVKISVTGSVCFLGLMMLAQLSSSCVQDNDGHRSVGLLLEKKNSLRLPRVPQFPYFRRRNPFSFVLCKTPLVQKCLARLAAAL